jgi:hypothetical protein
MYGSGSRFLFNSDILFPAPQRTVFASQQVGFLAGEQRVKQPVDPAKVE